MELFTSEDRRMTHAQAVKALDQLIDGLKRAEESRKDIDLLMVMRIVEMLLEDWIRKDK